MKLASPPSASDDAEEIADWVEMEALLVGSCSRTELVTALNQGGTVTTLLQEEVGDDAPVVSDPGSTRAQGVADDAFSEIDDRSHASGAAYPFDVEAGAITRNIDPDKSPYVFLMLLARQGPTSGHDGTSVLFETICAAAAGQYIQGGQSHRFGAPRKPPFTRFGKALDNLCTLLAEGGGQKAGTKGNHNGDGGLDIVAWKPFLDGRSSKLIVFGQCAAGKKSSYSGKLTELDGLKFAKKYFREQLPVDPVRFFFVPWRLPRSIWEKAAIDGGLLFDRCRIAAQLLTPDNALAARISAAVTDMLAIEFGSPLGGAAPAAAAAAPEQNAGA